MVDDKSRKKKFITTEHMFIVVGSWQRRRRQQNRRAGRREEKNNYQLKTEKQLKGCLSRSNNDFCRNIYAERLVPFWCNEYKI